MPPPNKPADRALSIDEVRIVSDLRVMHAKVDDLFHFVQELRRRYTEVTVYQYADKDLLSQDIERVDELYLWYVKLREERDRNPAGR